MTDKVQLEMKPEPGSIDLARTALLMIDMQVMYMNINTKIHDYYDYYDYYDDYDDDDDYDDYDYYYDDDDD